MEFLSQDESAGPVPEGVDPVAWARIEAWVARRWTPRTVVWVVKGPGVFRPPLGPVPELVADIWTPEGYEPAMFDNEPEGPVLRAATYRITATVGAGPVPAEALEAAARLSAYLSEGAGVGIPGASSYGVNLGQIGENFRRNPAWMARAMEWSGAADLLRPYRRA